MLAIFGNSKKVSKEDIQRLPQEDIQSTAERGYSTIAGGLRFQNTIRPGLKLDISTNGALPSPG